MTFDPTRPSGQPLLPPQPQPAPRMEAFSPVAPEPFDPSTLEVPVAPIRATGGSSGALNMALAVAVLVAATGIAFALGRASAPAGTVTPAANTQGAGAGNGTANGNGGTNGGTANGGAPAAGGNLPNASFDLNGNGGSGPGGNGDTDGGLGLDRAGGGSVQGTVQTVAADGVTLKLANGRTITIGLDGNTTYHTSAPATVSDVAAGKTVIVRVGGGFRPTAGTNNGSGGIRFGTATDVTVVP